MPKKTSANKTFTENVVLYQHTQTHYLYSENLTVNIYLDPENGPSISLLFALYHSTRFICLDKYLAPFLSSPLFLFMIGHIPCIPLT